VNDEAPLVNTNRLPVWFAGIALLFGSAMVFLTPPFQVTDEFWHFFRAYQVSQGGFVAKSQGNAQGAVLPFSLLRLANRFAKLPQHPAEKTSFKAILDARQIPLDPGQETFTNFPFSANYSPLVYAPQAIAMAVGRWAGLKPLAFFYLGREATLLAWTAAGFFTLRLVPGLRAAILILMLMPMSLSLAASMSADAVTIALCLLFTALVWHCGAGKDASFEIGRRSKAAIFGLSIGVSLCKFAYWPLISLVLLIPPVRFGGTRRYVRFIVVMVVTNIVVSVAWMSQTAGTKLVLRPERTDVNASGQMAFVRSHPIAFCEAVGRGLEHDGPFIVASFVGNLGWIDTPLPPVVVGVYLLALLAACVPMRGDPTVPAGWQLGVIAAAVCACVVIFAFLNYLVWTPVGGLRLEGLQGRYFIPLGAAGLILIWGAMRRYFKAIPPRPDAWQINLIAIGLCICGCFYTLLLLLRRYFEA